MLYSFIVQWTGQVATNDQMGVRIPLKLQNGRVIKLALDLVLKTSGTERYGDRYLTLPQKGKIRAVWTKLGGFENRRP